MKRSALANSGRPGVESMVQSLLPSVVNKGTVTTLVGLGWTPEALAVVERACAYYGGLAGWQRLRTVRLIPDRLSGLVPRLKGVGRTFPIPALFEVAPHARAARFVGYPEAEQVGVFASGVVRIERLAMCSRSSYLPTCTHTAAFSGSSSTRRDNSRGTTTTARSSAIGLGARTIGIVKCVAQASPYPWRGTSSRGSVLGPVR